MKKAIILLLLCLPFIKTYGQDNLTVNVHPGIELFTIIQILGDQYPDPNPSTYSKEVMDYFGKYKSHPAVVKVKSLGKVYSDFPELGYTMTGFPDIKIYQPEDLSWYKRYGKDTVLEYLSLCKDFAKESNFWAFFQAHQEKYAKWGSGIREQVAKSGTMEQLQKFYGKKGTAQWNICIDPLNSWGSHAIATKKMNPAFGNIIVYNTGYFNEKSTEKDEPVFAYQGFDYLVWHEGSHIFLDPYFIKYKKEIDELAYLFNKDDDGMKRNTIGTWEYCLNENMVRAIVGDMYKNYRTERQYKRQVAKETANDFIYVEDLVPFIAANYGPGKKYTRFDDFFPTMLTMLKEKHPKQ
ncbi:DUF4932 domain-containing protein [Pedobacter duraquae]|uniref:Uncharacterized protein DUF4932 n=1 Tax=Pedobacter duraquae TaxID=425511 RepID=A0A4R6ILL6_9SPHI|nr:DUF4932 domain-containing protein [Pedobacter duraquae]TDO23034.1 uncharacterized protein DUF4932 [Pedobacter duraquae]